MCTDRHTHTIHIYTHKNTCTYVHVHAPVACTHVCAHTFANIHICTHAYANKCIHIGI